MGHSADALNKTKSALFGPQVPGAMDRNLNSLKIKWIQRYFLCLGKDVCNSILSFSVSHCLSSVSLSLFPSVYQSNLNLLQPLWVTDDWNTHQTAGWTRDAHAHVHTCTTQKTTDTHFRDRNRIGDRGQTEREREMERHKRDKQQDRERKKWKLKGGQEEAEGLPSQNRPYRQDSTTTLVQGYWAIYDWLQRRLILSLSLSVCVHAHTHRHERQEHIHVNTRYDHLTSTKLKMC